MRSYRIASTVRLRAHETKVLEKLDGYRNAAGIGYLIIDVQEPVTLASAPSSMLHLPTECSYIAADGNYLYIKGQNQIYVVDVTVPSAPVLTATIANPFSNSWTFEDCTWNVADGRLYASTSEKMAVYDVSSPAAPSLLGNLNYGATGYSGLDFGLCSNIVIRDGKAYLEITDDYQSHKVLVVDVSVPTNPMLLGASNVYALKQAEFYPSDRLSVRGNYCFVNGVYGTFVVVDVQDPTAPNKFSSRAWSPALVQPAQSMYFSENYFICVDQHMDIQYVKD